MLTYNLEWNPDPSTANSLKDRRFRITNAKSFNDFFPKSLSPLLSIDFLIVSETQRLWAFGYRNGYVCIYFINGVRFDDRQRLRYCLYFLHPR